MQLYRTRSPEERGRLLVQSLAGCRLPPEVLSLLRETRRVQWTVATVRELVDAGARAVGGDPLDLIRVLLREREKVLRLVQ